MESSREVYACRRVGSSVLDKSMPAEGEAEERGGKEEVLGGEVEESKRGKFGRSARRRHAVICACAEWN